MLKIRRMIPCAGLMLCVCFSILPVVADTVEQSDSPFIVDSWSTEQGLPQSSVISVIQTRDGYLWLGTLNGLVRFDGISFTVFDEENTPGLSGDRIVYLFQDSRTNLWIGMDTGDVALVKDGKIQNFSRGHSGHEGRLLYAFEDSKGIVWFYTADGRTSQYQDGKMTTDPSVISTELVLRAAKILAPSLSGGFWSMQNGRVQKWRNNHLEKDFGSYPWGNSPISSTCEDKDGNLIVGTLGVGVYWYEANGKYRHISTEQGLSSAFVLSLCMDREGNLWVGTDGGGLNRVKRKIFNTPGGLYSWSAQSLSTDAAGGLWMAFNAHGMTHWLTNSAQDFGVGRGSNAWTVLVDQQQRVWVGTRDEGLFQFQINQFQPVPGAKILGSQIFALFENRLGQLWAGTQNGLACWNGQGWKMHTTQDGLSGNAVRAIAEDAEGNLWAGTENHGLNLFKAGKFISYRQETNGLPGNDISCLYTDKTGVLWVGTFGHGLARFYNGKWTRYSTRDGLASNSIGYIIEDDQGYIWIGSNAGLMRIQKKSLDDFANGKTDFILCRIYGEADGLPTRECSSGSQPATGLTPDGILWLPTTKGVASVNPKKLKPNLQPPLVMIESALVDGREQKTNHISSFWPQSIVVQPGHDRFEIRYTSLNFTAPKEVRFKYRLEGRDTAWTEAGDTRVAHYSEVPPGHYQFHVIACNEDGVWNNTGSVLKITVQPQFWQTGGFRAVVILCFLGIVVAVVRFVSTQKLHRQLALEKERSRIARDLHDQLGANLTQVALLGEMAEADKGSPEEIQAHAQQISQTARETTRSLDEIVWAVNPSNDTLDGLVTYICKYAQEYLALAGLRYRADMPAQLPAIALPPEVRHNIFLAFKEAVNNVVKHARASEVQIRLQLQPDHFILEIEDNGRGLGKPDTIAAQSRDGLRNMRGRMEDIGGKFEIGAASERGTIVRLTVPARTK
jgi:ligand-binding sensor domain-containing protein/two-component sensor histidine kinase